MDRDQPRNRASAQRACVTQRLTDRDDRAFASATMVLASVVGCCDTAGCFAACESRRKRRVNEMLASPRWALISVAIVAACADPPTAASRRADEIRNPDAGHGRSALRERIAAGRRARDHARGSPHARTSPSARPIQLAPRLTRCTSRGSRGLAPGRGPSTWRAQGPERSVRPRTRCSGASLAGSTGSGRSGRATADYGRATCRRALRDQSARGQTAVRRATAGQAVTQSAAASGPMATARG